MKLRDSDLICFLTDALGLPAGTGVEAALFSNGALDSVAMMNLIAFVEERTGVEVRPEDVTLENFDSPSRIIRYAESRA